MTKEVDLRNENVINDLLNKKRTYELNDKTISSVILDGGIKIQLIENEKGKYIDIRKFYNEHPTKKGIRLPVQKFKQTLDVLRNDIEKYSV